MFIEHFFNIWWFFERNDVCLSQKYFQQIFWNLIFVMFFPIQPKFKMRYYLTFNTDIRHSHSNMYISNYNWRETRKTFSPTLSCKWNFSPDMTFSMFVYTTPSRNFSFSHNTFLTFLGKSLSLSSKISSHTCTELSVGRFSSALFTFFHDTHFTLIYLWNTQTAFYTVYTSHIKGHDLIIIVGCHLIYRSINIQFNTDDAIPCHPNIFCVCRFFFFTFTSSSTTSEHQCRIYSKQTTTTMMITLSHSV